MKRAALLAALALAGCGSDPRPAAQPRPAALVQIEDFQYRPAPAQVAAGARVTFTNRDRAPHTATTTAAPARLDTGTLRQGESYAQTLTRPGTYAYICELHPFMKATIIVRDR